MAVDEEKFSRALDDVAEQIIEMTLEELSDCVDIEQVDEKLAVIVSRVFIDIMENTNMKIVKRLNKA